MQVYNIYLWFTSQSHCFLTVSRQPFDGLAERLKRFTVKILKIILATQDLKRFTVKILKITLATKDLAGQGAKGSMKTIFRRGSSFDFNV